MRSRVVIKPVVLCIFLIIFLLTLFISGCRSNVKIADHEIIVTTTSMIGSNTAVSLAQDTSQGTTVLVNQNHIKPQEDEFFGLVYQGYVRKDMWEGDWGWDLKKLCEILNINMVIEDDAYGIYSKYNIPINFYLEINKTRLVFKGDTGNLNEIELKNPDQALISYKVFKNGKEMVMLQAPVTFKMYGPGIEVRELLKMLDINYYEDAHNIYMSSTSPTEIKGKILFDSWITLNSGKKLSSQLIYSYAGNHDPNYSSIEMHINDGVEHVIKLFDENNLGSETYYDCGYLQAISFGGEDFIEANLARDTFIFKYADRQLSGVFSRNEYQNYLDGNFKIEGREDGFCLFTDRMNNFSKVIICDDVKPKTTYCVSPLLFYGLAQDHRKNEFVLQVDEGTVQDGKWLFSFTIEFIYDDKQFVPATVSATNQKQYYADKADGKDVSSMTNYRYFEYTWKN
jgi:hypothetical protein